MSKDRLIVNEVIVVGKVREGQEKTVLPTDLAPNNPELLKAMREKFQFVRSTVLNNEAKLLNFQQGEFIHVLVADPGGSVVTLPNGKTIKVSRKTNDYGWKVIFKGSNGITFDEIKDEIVSNRFEVIGTGMEGKIRLTEYGLMGFWDEFPIGFTYNPHFRNAQGKLENLMSHPRGADGKYGNEKAKSNTGRHFVLEGEVENLEGLRNIIRQNAEQFKVTVATNDDANRTTVQEIVPDASKVDINTSV